VNEPPDEDEWYNDNQASGTPGGFFGLPAGKGRHHRSRCQQTGLKWKEEKPTEMKDTGMKKLQAVLNDSEGCPTIFCIKAKTGGNA